MGRPKEHDDDTRRALLAAAEQLLHEGGAAAVSARAVADAAGTSTRAVYSVFGSMPGLLDALATRLFDLLGAAIDRLAPTDDPEHDLVTAAIDGFRRVALEHTALFNLVFLRVVPEAPFGPGAQASAALAFGRLEALVSRVTRARNAGSGGDQVAAARTVHALTEGLAAMELRGSLGTPSQAEAAWRGALTIVVRGLGDASANPPPVKRRSSTAPRPATARP